MATDGRKNIVVIGGGIIGCTSAYFLTRHPAYDPSKHRITLLESTKIAGGASGKAGGLLALWAYPSCIVPLSYRLHKELADEHGGEERWGYRALHCGQVECQGRELSEKGAPGAGGKDGEMEGRNGKTKVEREGLSLQKRSKEALGRLRAAGVPADLDWVDPETRPRYEEMGDPSTTAQVHPWQFTTAMAELAGQKGAVIKTRARVKSINYHAAGEAVESVTYIDSNNDHGHEETIRATDVVVAAGPWTPHLLPQVPISATRAHSVTIKPSRPVSAYALFTQISLPAHVGTAARSSRHSAREHLVTPEIYARPGNEVYACGEGDTDVPLPGTSDEVLVDEARCQAVVDSVAAISEALREGDVTARQACYLPGVRTGGGPLVGATGVEGLVLAAGHTCWGVQNAPGTGKLVSEVVFEGRARSARVAGLDPRRYM